RHADAIPQSLLHAVAFQLLAVADRRLAVLCRAEFLRGCGRRQAIELDFRLAERGHRRTDPDQPAAPGLSAHLAPAGTAHVVERSGPAVHRDPRADRAVRESD